MNSPVRVDLRSYEKQGLDIIPAVHMGAAVTQMERRGIQTNIGNLNRDIKAANRMMSVIRSTIQNLRDWISDILEARKELLAEKKPEDRISRPYQSSAGLSQSEKGRTPGLVKIRSAKRCNERFTVLCRRHQLSERP